MVNNEHRIRKYCSFKGIVFYYILLRLDTQYSCAVVLLHPGKVHHHSITSSLQYSNWRALIGHPEIFLFDEPFASLDTFTRTRIQEELINIWLSERFTAVFVTHNINEAILMGNKIVLLGGQPSRIKDIVDINLKYPRNLTDESFFHSRTSILKKFKEAFAGNNSL